MKKVASIALMVLAVWFCSSKHTQAQQDPMYSMYMFNKMLINPAYTGSANWMVGTAKYRSQFNGFEGGPTTQTFSFHTPIKRRYVGLGLKIVNDQIAIVRNLNAALSYSYHLRLAGGKLSLGLETGLYTRNIEYADLTLTELGDLAIPQMNQKATVPDASFGVYYQKKQFYAGFSSMHLLRTTFDDNVSGNSQSRLYAHQNLMAGYVFELNNTWTVEPSFLMKTVSGAPAQLDLNGIVYYNDQVGLGIQYRTGDAIGAMVRVNLLENLRIAYAYDATISGLSPYSGGAHELVVSFGLKLPPPPTVKEIHPRYYF